MQFPAFAQSVASGTGTGDLPIGATPAGRQSLSDAVGYDKPFFYSIDQRADDQWEEGIGLITADDPDLLVRLRCIQGSSGSNFVNFADGSKLASLVSPSLIHEAAYRTKSPCRVAIAEPITLNAMDAGSEFGGVMLSAGDRVLLASQADATENGLWVIRTALSPIRPVDFFPGSPARGTIVQSLAGELSGASFACVSLSGSDIIDLDELQFRVVSPAVPVEAEPESLTTWGTGGSTSLRDNPAWKIHGESQKLRAKCRYIPRSPVVDGFAPTIDGNATDHQRVLLTVNAAPTVTNATIDQFLFVRIRQDNTGSRLLDWSNVNVYWASGISHTMTPTANREDAVMLHCVGLDQYGNPAFMGYIIAQNSVPIESWDDYEPVDPPEGLILYDGFTAANGTLINSRALEFGGETWSAPTQLEIQSHKMISTSGYHVAITDAGQTDYKASIEVGGFLTAEATAGITVRRSGTTSRYDVLVINTENHGSYPIFNPALCIIEVSGTGTLVAQTPITPVATAILSVECDGDDLRCDYNGTSLHYDTMGTHSTGEGVGVSLNGLPTLDDFTVEELP